MEETSGVRQILGEALDKIKQRADRCREIQQRVQPELSEADRAIKALEKVLEPTLSTRRSAEPRDTGAGRSPRAAFTAKVIELLKDGPRSADSIVHHFGSSVRYVEGILDNAVQRGELSVSDDGRTYSVPGGEA